jgi:DNA polymerase I-like protein with 3'-5' exonuclease and polymerase domains
MRQIKLAVGSDGRNRCLLSPFWTKTGRNQPSTTKYIFGLPSWLRALIRPEQGKGVAYIDWEQQEFGIAAYLSRDLAMIEAYESRDPYLGFAKQAGAVPEGATKATHGRERELFKECALAVQYGMGAAGLAECIGQSERAARELLRLHKTTYPRFWEWSDGAVAHGMLRNHLYTVFGWTIQMGQQPNSLSIRNFPMQANGAEMLRLACCFATEMGVRVCGPVHDALLIEAPVNELAAAIEATRLAMARASKAVLGGPVLRTDVTTVVYPGRYRDSRGQRMWDMIWSILGEPDDPCSPATQPVQPCTPAQSNSKIIDMDI